MSMPTTREAIRAICATDPSVTADQLRAALLALDASSVTTKTKTAAPADEAMSRSEVAALLKVTPKTITKYAAAGLIRGITCGDKRGHVRRYSAASVRALLAGKAVA